PNSAQTTVSFSQPGTYVFQLKVKDSSSDTSTNTDTVLITITVLDYPAPVPQITASATTVHLPVNFLTLYGSDASKQNVTYVWSKEAGPDGYEIVSPTSASTEIKNLQEGQYKFKLTLTNERGQVTAKEITINVVNDPPMAKATTDRPMFELSENAWENVLTLSGLDSTDPDGSIDFYEWTLKSPDTDAARNSISIASPNDATTSVNISQPGTYIFQLKVKDNLGKMDTVLITIETVPPGRPVANAGEDKTIRLPENSVELDGSKSRDPNGTFTCQWKQLEGPGGYRISGSNTEKLKLNNLQEGVYVFELTITDNDGNTHADRVTVTVLPEPHYIDPADLTDLHQPIDKDMIGIIINKKVTDAVIEMSHDDKFLLSYEANTLSALAEDNLRLLPKSILTRINQLLNEGSKAELNKYLNSEEVRGWLKAERAKYSEARFDVYNPSAGRMYDRLLAVDVELNKICAITTMDNLLNSAYVNNHTPTPFIQVDTYKFNQLKETILIGAYLQKLLTMITQAKGDSRNAIQEILIQQSGYQKMNIEKLNDKQTTYLT
ncbi:hypothetical protein NO1_2173, partial [Candidatus Termititenax aidoneus]